MDERLSHHLPNEVVLASVGDLHFKHAPHKTRLTLYQHLYVCVCVWWVGRGEGVDGGIIDRWLFYPGRAALTERRRPLV